MLSRVGSRINWVMPSEDMQFKKTLVMPSYLTLNVSQSIAGKLKSPQIKVVYLTSDRYFRSWIMLIVEIVGIILAYANLEGDRLG